MASIGSLSAFGQTDCSCAIDRSLVINLLSVDDSTAIFNYTATLRKENSTCRFESGGVEIDYLTTHKKYDAALSLLEQLDKDLSTSTCPVQSKVALALAYCRFHKAKDDFENLSKYAFQALNDAETLKDHRSVFLAITYAVYTFTRQGQDDKNWPYILRARDLVLKEGGTGYIGHDYNWLAFEFENKYTETQRKSLIDSAARFAQIAKADALKRKDYEQIVRSIRVLESNAYHSNDLKKAVNYIDSAIYYAKKIKKPKSLSPLYVAKAWDHVDLKENAEAIRWMDTGVYYTKKHFGNSLGSINVHLEASNIYEAAGNLPKAYAAFKFYEHIKDSLFKRQRAEKINELEQKYQKASNERTIRELAQEKQIYLLMAVAGLLTVVAIAFYVRQQSLKHKQNILETEQRLNRARMNPHFFFNALTALQKFALTGADGNVMASNLSRFSHIMRETLESTYKEYVTIEQEMEFLREYLEVQKIRFPQAFTFEISADKSLDVSDLLIPSMIIQPFVENTLEHGFSGIAYPGKVSVSFQQANNEVVIEIKDNGKGLTGSPKDSNEHISRASQIIKDRIYLLNIKLKSKAGFSIDNVADGNGVLVKINLPVLHN